MEAKDWFIGLPQGKDNIFELTREQILKLLDDYAGEVVKNLNIPAVMGELTCDNCGCHPNVIYTTSKGRFCERCKPAS